LYSYILPKDKLEETHSQLRRQLEQSETALLYGNKAIVFRHGRWHYLTLGDMVGGRGIQAPNFLSTGRTESLIADWLSDDTSVDLSSGAPWDETAVLSYLAQMMASGQAGSYGRFR
jgi:hypothetical protein